MFGPGWTASFPGPGAGWGDYTITDHTPDGYIVLTGPDGEALIYQATTAVGSYPVTFAGVGDATADGSVLVKVNASTITLTDTDGTVTTWMKSGSLWGVSSIVEAGSASTTTYTRDSSGRITGILAPVPAGVTCSSPLTTPGCRSLTLNYVTVTVGGTTYTRLGSVDFTAYDPVTAATVTITVAAYDYDSNGRLAHAWDPRISPALKTAYTYDGNGRLATITPPGLAAWTLHYDGTGRLASVTRPDPANGTATLSVGYDVPAAGGSAPVDLSGTTAATWGQDSDFAERGAAVWPASHVPAATPTATDYTYATLHYRDVNGREVNTAVWGLGKWLVDTTRFDQHGNDVWSLTARNRAHALVATADTDPAAAALTGAGNTADAADLLATASIYNADGSELLETRGPVHPVLLDDGSTVDARDHTVTAYDQGAPGTGGPYQLPTTTTTSVEQLDGTDLGVRITKTGYAAIVAGDTTGWALRQATSTTVQMGPTASGADLVTITRYNPSGRVVETRLPAGAAGGDAHSTITSYYTATGTGACVSAAAAGLLCSTGPAAQPSTGDPLPTVTTTYNLYDQPLTVTETYGSTGVIRTATTGYDAAGRPVSSSIAVTPSAAGGTVLPTVTTGYDTATGLAATQSTTTGGVTTTLTTGYDSLGRMVSYTDAAGTVSTTGYDIDGLPTVTDDGLASTTRTYDDGTGADHRRLLSSLDAGTGTAPGTFTGTYDESGNLVSQTYPNGLTASWRFDDTDSPVALSYAMGGVEWLSFTQVGGVDGHTLAVTGPLSSQVFGYDYAGRLIQTQDTVSDGAGGATCTIRSYTFDKDSNRTGYASYPDDGSDPSNPVCTTTTTATSTVASTFDEADRLTNTGYVYDTLGRTTTVPAADAVGSGTHAGLSGDLAAGYYANNLVASQAQGGATRLYGLDPMQNRIATTTEGTTSTVNHYDGDADSPSWTETTTSGATTTSRSIAGIGGDLAATQDQTGTVTLQLGNLHGDIVATVSDDPAATGTSSYAESTEYGQARDPAGAYPDYGWLGTKQRSANALGGIILMGVRLYNPATGRFLTVDPLCGGNANTYMYPANPVDSLDTSGAANWDKGDWSRAYTFRMYRRDWRFGNIPVRYGNQNGNPHWGLNYARSKHPEADSFLLVSTALSQGRISVNPFSDPWMWYFELTQSRTVTHTCWCGFKFRARQQRRFRVVVRVQPRRGHHGEFNGFINAYWSGWK